MNLQLLGIAALVLVVGTAAAIHRIYAAGSASAEYRLVAESAQALREARDKAAERAQEARTAMDAAHDLAEHERAQGRAQALSARNARLAAAAARAEAEGVERCPTECYVVQPQHAGQ